MQPKISFIIGTLGELASCCMWEATGCAANTFYIAQEYTRIQELYPSVDWLVGGLFPCFVLVVTMVSLLLKFKLHFIRQVSVQSQYSLIRRIYREEN